MARMLKRYEERERMNHWFIVLMFLLAGLSGLAFFHPSLFFLSNFFGGGPWARILHPFLGVLMVVALLSIRTDAAHIALSAAILGALFVLASVAPTKLVWVAILFPAIGFFLLWGGSVWGPLGALAGFAVGLVVLHQVLATDIRNQLPLYATLKAMGYGDRRLRRLVLEQAGILVGLAFGPAVALAAAIFALVHALTLLPIALTPGLLAFVAGLTVLMSAAAALASEHRLRRADPAELY